MFSKIINKLKELLGINNKISKQEEINIFSNIKVGNIVWANRYENKEELEKRKQLVELHKLTLKDDYIDNDYISC